MEGAHRQWERYLPSVPLVARERLEVEREPTPPLLGIQAGDRARPHRQGGALPPLLVLLQRRKFLGGEVGVEGQFRIQGKQRNVRENSKLRSPVREAVAG